MFKFQFYLVYDEKVLMKVQKVNVEQGEQINLDHIECSIEIHLSSYSYSTAQFFIETIRRPVRTSRHRTGLLKLFLIFKFN